MSLAGVNATPSAQAASSQAAQTATQAKRVGLAFEQVLVSELAQQMAQTASTPDDGSSSGGSDGSAGTTTGLMGSDPASNAYAQMIPSVLTSSIMSTGGTGIAQQIAQSIDPALTTNPSLGGTPALDPSLNLNSALGASSSLGGSL